MGDLKVSETFQDAVYITVIATGAAASGLAPTCTFVKIADGTRTAGTVQEVGDGWYRVTDFTPNTAGTWTTEWAVLGAYTIHYPYKEFKVGGGRTEDIHTLVDTEIATIDGFHDVPAADTVDNNQMRDVIGNKTDTVAGNSIIAIAKLVLSHITNGTYGLATLETLIDRHVVTRTWFSDPQEEVSITNGAGDKSLPYVVLPNITGTIAHVYAGFKFRMVENTNAAANKLNGAQTIQVKESIAGAYTDAVTFVDDLFTLAASTREGGDCIVGNIDVSGEVTVFNKIYLFQWHDGIADQSNLNFNDVQTFLIVSYY